MKNFMLVSQTAQGPYYAALLNRLVNIISKMEPMLINYLKWWETLLLVFSILHDIEGKRLV